MRNWNKLFRVSAFILSILTLVLYFLTFYILEGWITVFILMAGVIAFALTSICIILLFTRNILKRNHSIGNYIPIFIFLVVILVIFFKPVDRLIEYSKSPIILHGYCEHTVTTVSLTLRADRTFEYYPGAFLSHDIGIGTYKIESDSIFLFFDAESEAITVNDTLVFDDNNIYEIGNDTTHLHIFEITVNELNRPVPNNVNN